MTDDRSLERAARSWLELGPTTAPEAAVQAALRTIETTHQERGPRVWIPWRVPRMNGLMRMATATAVVLVGLGAVYVVGTRPNADPGPGPASSPSASAAPITPSPEPSVTPAPTPTPSPSPSEAQADISFASTIYPYSIVLPGELFGPGPIVTVPLPGEWQAATVVWDGTTALFPSGPELDSVAATDGDQLYVFGRPAEEGLEAFAATMIATFPTWQGCSAQPATRTATADGEPAVMLASSCNDATRIARLIVVHDGFGLVFSTLSNRAIGNDELMDRLATFLDPLDLLP